MLTTVAGLQANRKQDIGSIYGKNYYKILGISEGAQSVEIQKAYKGLAMKYHPDKNKTPGAEDMFKKVAEAYEILSDKKKREVYDMYGKEGLKGYQEFSGSGVNSTFLFRRDPIKTFTKFVGLFPKELYHIYGDCMSSFMMGRAYYIILGKSREATIKEMKKDYSVLALTYPLDKKKSAGSEGMINQVTKVNEILTFKKEPRENKEEGLKGNLVFSGSEINSTLSSSDPIETFTNFNEFMMEKDYYKILGISREATTKEIKKTYRKLVLKYHPDKYKPFTAEDIINKFAEAYQILGDNKKREVYDTYGEEGLKGNHGFSGSGINSAFPFCSDSKETYSKVFGSSNTFFEGFNPGTAGGSASDNIYHDIDLDSDQYRNIGVDSLSLRGSSCRLPQSFNIHGSNHSRKDKVQDSPIEHDLYVSLDEVLKGAIKILEISRKVLLLDGTAIKEDKLLTVRIMPGWKAGMKITFKGEGDQEHNKIPADIVFRIKDEPHPLFTREGSDIRYTAKISLKSALCGTQIDIPTLMGESIPLNLSREVITPSTVKRIQGHGLPLLKEPTCKGDLIVSFDIIFPDVLTSSAKDILQDVLPN